MAYNYPVVLISMQHDVPRDQVGFATSGLTWIRNQGATFGTALMGLILTSEFRARAGSLLDPGVFRRDPEFLFRPETLALIQSNPQLWMAGAMFWVFSVMALATLVALGAALAFPRKEFRS
jgi:hypothetical protein